MTTQIKIIFSPAYGGGVKGDVYIGAKRYVLDLDYLEQFLIKQITEKGYTTNISSRQKYPRININL